jgi:circadian clock protein KaiC
VQLRDAYLGPAGVLTGSARVAQEAREREEQIRLQRENADRRLTASRKLRSAEAQIAALQAEKEAVERELKAVLEESQDRIDTGNLQRAAMARSRKVNLQAKAARPKAGEAGG